MTIKKLSILFVFLLITELSFSFMIYPKELKKNIAKETSETFTLINTDNKIYTVKIEEVFEDSNIEIQIYPKIFVLNSKEERMVKIALKSKNKEKKRVYSGKIKFTLIPLELKEVGNIIIDLYIDSELHNY